MAARKGPTPRKAAAGKPAPRKDFEVVPNAAGGFDGQCLRSFGCGVPGGSPFASTGWTTRQQAETRMAEHIAEHDDKTPMTPMHEFCGVHAPELLPG
jgi:hypothetical protein